MKQRELLGVQRLAREAQGLRDGAAGFFPVCGIADERMANGVQMHPDLVRAAGFKPAAQQSRRREAFDHVVVGDGRFAAGDDRHARALHRGGGL